MNVAESIKFLEKLGYKVYKNATVQELIADRFSWRELTAAEKKKIRKQNGNQALYKIWGPNSWMRGVYTARKLIDFARGFKKHNGAKSTAKNVNHSKNRSKARNLIATENFDSLPAKKDIVKLDPWDWD